MLIKNYFTPPLHAAQPALDLQIIEDVTDVIVYAGCFDQDNIGSIESAGVTSVYDNGEPLHPEAFKGRGSVGGGPVRLCRHVDFTRKADGVRCRLIVRHHAYICNDTGKTVEHVNT